MDRNPGFRRTGRDHGGRGDRRHDGKSVPPPPEQRRAATQRPALMINLAEQWQVRWWCDHFRVTYRELFEAIGEVGTSAEAVRRRLGR